MRDAHPRTLGALLCLIGSHATHGAAAPGEKVRCDIPSRFINVGPSEREALTKSNVIPMSQR
jgi:hypothetical protein